MTQRPQTVSAPPTFQDSEKRSWTIKLTLDLIDHVHAKTQIDLALEDFSSDATEALVGLLFQHRKLGVLLWECCHQQAASLTVTEGNQDRPFTQRDFKAALDGDALFAGWRAVVDAITFFIRSRSPNKAEAFEKAIEKGLEVMEVGAEMMVKVLCSPETADQLKKTADALGAEMQADLTKELGNCVTSLPR